MGDQLAELHVPIDRARGRLAGQIADRLREAVREGRLPPGTRLPASRDLAGDLGVSRGTVVEAYEQLVAEGFLISRVGSGTRVADQVSPRADDPPQARPAGPAAGPYHGYRATSPDLTAFPRTAWLAALRHALTTMPHDALDYADPGGVFELRAELADYLRRVRAAEVAPDTLVVVNGVALGVSLAVRVLAAREPGGRLRLAVEDPASARQLPLLRAAGADLVRVPVDHGGIDVAALARSGARAVLLTPAHSFPTGVVLSPERRSALIAWANDTGAVVLEDDYDAEFRFDRDPVGCLQGLAPGRVVLTGSVSKALSPGLRLGWLAAPPGIAAAVRRAREDLDLGSPVIEQYALAHFLRTGAYDRHLRRMRREYRARRDALVQALAEHLPEAAVHGISAGLHLYAELPRGWDEAELAAAAQACGLGAEPVAPMRAAPGPPALVIGFARLPAHRLRQAVQAMARRAARWRTAGAGLSR